MAQRNALPWGVGLWNELEFGEKISPEEFRDVLVAAQLPDELVPPDWDPPRLRAAYDDFELAFQSLLRTFLHGLS